MKPQTFLIKSDNPYLLKALVEDLVKEGYKAEWGEPYEYCKSICSNVHNNMTLPNYKVNWKLYMSVDTYGEGSEFHKTFTLPEDYSQAFKFAVRQLKIVNGIIELEEAVAKFNFKKGNYYTSFDEDGLWQIFIFDKFNGENIDCIDYVNTSAKAYFHNHDCDFDTRVIYKPSTPEEIQWLDACIKTNTFVSKENAIKYTLEEGEYYKVVEDDFWMIGKVSKGNNGNNNDLLLRGDYSYSIDSDRNYDVDGVWCYYCEGAGDVTRNFTKLSKDSDEVKWLEACHNAGKYLTKEEALKPKPTIKVGDIVIVTNQHSKNDASVGRLVKVVRIDNSGVPYKTEDYYKLYNWSKSTSWCAGVRLATQEEINEALLNKAKKSYPIGTHFKSAFIPNNQTIYSVEKDYYNWYRDNSIVVNHRVGPSIYYEGNWAEIVESKPETKTAKFGEVTFTIKGNNDYATTKYGKITKKSIEKAIEYIKNPPSLGEYSLRIHVGSKYESLDFPDNLFKIGFGCQSGTLQELENILRCFD